MELSEFSKALCALTENDFADLTRKNSFKQLITEQLFDEFVETPLENIIAATDPELV